VSDFSELPPNPSLGSKLALHHAFLMNSKLRCVIQTEIVGEKQINMNGVAVGLISVSLEQLPCGNFFTAPHSYCYDFTL